ncbi:MAG: maleylacetoacetate isomerase [Betaproteobacteria bacterium]|nr:maleylacetoacetate isomerase [Betaproteobacteria bacterium]
MTVLTLYGYWRSSAAYRVRIALELKGLAYQTQPVHLTRAGGDQHAAPFQALNPQGLVPVLVDGEEVLSQSLAIIEYLEETHPAPPLLPGAPAARARVRALAQVVACDLHPLNNLRVLRYLDENLGASADAQTAWYHHWLQAGLAALERRLGTEPGTGKFCHGATPTVADLCLVPQLYNARRHALDLAPFPTLTRIETACQALPAFAAAAPERQPDAV